MRYGMIKRYDVANGSGVRVSLFVSGCKNRCAGCFQRETWDFDYGEEFTEDTVREILAALSKPFIQGLTVLGGDPFEVENQEAVLALLARVKAEFPQKDIWCYTGYVLESDLLGEGGRRRTKHTDALLGLIDVLVDGPFVQEKKDLSLQFRGSSNQRIIDLRQGRRGQRS